MNRKPKMHLTWVAVGLVTLAVTTPLTAQNRQSADALLQQAVHQELVAGELDRAIEQYRAIVAQHPAERAIAAKALTYLGRAYEKLGRREAQAAYERVVREYADQTEPAQFARARLQALQPDAFATAGKGDGGSPTYTMVVGDLRPLRERDTPQLDLSPTGDRVVFQRWIGDTLLGTRVYVADRGGSVVRLLFEPQPRAWRSTPRWSPDGRWIAYFEQRRVGNSSPMAIVVVSPEGAARRVLVDSVQGIRPAAGGVFWTPDSRAITYAGAKNIRTVDLEGRLVRTVPFESRYLTQVTGYSPDGRWIAFHEKNAGTEQDVEMDVWLLPAEGGRAIQLTHAPGFDGWPTWAPDGKSVYFVSERSGSSNIWQLDVDPRSGLPRGDPRQVTSYADARIQYPKVIGTGNRLSFVLVRRTSVIHVAPTLQPSEARPVARGTSPQLSSDGRTVYYVGEGTGQEGIFAAPVAGGEPRRLTHARPGGPHFQPFFLSAGGDAIAYFSQSGGENALFTVPVDRGEPRELIRFESREHLVPSWSPDGSRLAYAHGNGLYTIPAAGGEPRKLAHLYSWDGWMVRWSPDGRHIAAFGWTEPQRTPPQPEVFNGLFVVPAEGGELRRITPVDDGGYKEGLDWHPDGQRLSYMDYGPNWGLDGTRQASLDGRPSAHLANQPDPLWDYVGRWAPDGRHFFFISAIRGFGNAWGLYVHDDSSRTTRVAWPDTAGNPGSSLPYFTADGRTMTWSVQNDVRQLWVMDWSAGPASRR
ncbi:MAG: PD40 domain-containing protein [Gemmatimonadetes bacterium]|nr:PD40 domain-containing protein [Gemmatimonadota bacterium]